MTFRVTLKRKILGLCAAVFLLFARCLHRREPRAKVTKGDRKTSYHGTFVTLIDKTGALWLEAAKRASNAYGSASRRAFSRPQHHSRSPRALPAPQSRRGQSPFLQHHRSHIATPKNWGGAEADIRLIPENGAINGAKTRLVKIEVYGDCIRSHYDAKGKRMTHDKNGQFRQAFPE